LRRHHIRTSGRKPHHVADANGNSMLVTVQTAYGFNITVHPAYASKFQKFFALLKERGYKVPANITKCWAPHGTHVAGSNHYIGAACDIQTGWNRGPEFVYHMNDIVMRDRLKLGVRAGVLSTGIARPQLHPIQSRCPEGREFRGSCS
jgi:hypothetical protein